MRENGPRFLMIRAMSQTEDEFAMFFKSSVVAVGWSQVDFSSHDEKELIAEIDNKYHLGSEIAPTTAGKSRAAVRRFKQLQAGDRIVVPFYSTICLATAKGEELYDASLVDSSDLSNQHRVQYRHHEGNVISIPRSFLSEGLQRRLRVRGSTILDLNEFREELELLWDASTDELLEGKVGWDVRFARWEQAQLDKVKLTLLNNITRGETNLQAGGIGLESLVKELLELEGYKAEIESKRRFAGFADADITASRSDIVFGSQQLLVQVKHHSGKSGSWGAHQLQKIRESEPDLFDSCKLVLVTSAGASQDLETMAKTLDIQLITGTELADWILEQLSHLSTKTRVRLGISSVPQVRSE